jgi:3-hydroxyisobutyrate dehydrogenase-like beta-hydroxyacid dehydrogenase
MSAPAVGVIGVGLLGGAIAERLLGAGFPVLGADPDPARREALERLGGRAASAAEVVRGCGRVVLSLPTSEVVASVLDAVEADLRPGQVVLDTTTGTPDASVGAGRRLSARGVSYLDATVSGSSEQVRCRDAVVVAGGDAEVLDACRDLLDTFARLVIHAGPCGAGSAMKLASNLVLGLNRAVLAEGLAFARSLGLDPAAALDAFREGAAYSRAMDVKGPKMVRGDFTPQARLSQHLKDVRLILEEAARTGAVVPLSTLHRDLLEAVEAAGLGGADNSAILRAFEPVADRSKPVE